jgi:hypothetical protein
MKLITQDGDRILFQVNRTKYDTPHQGKRERARRLRQLIQHPELRSFGMLEGDLLTELLKCK